MSYQTFACFYLWMTIYYCTWARLLLQHPKFYTNILFFTYFKGQPRPLYVHWMPDDNQEYACITDLTLCWKKLGSRYLSYLLANSTLISVHLTWNRTKENVQGYPINFCLNKFITNRRSPYNNLLYIIPIKETVLPHMWSWFLHLETALFWIHLSRSHPQSDHHCNQCQVSCESKCSIRRYSHQFPQQFLEEIAKQQHQKEFNLLTLY